MTEKEPTKGKKCDLYKSGRITKIKINPKVPSEESFGSKYPYFYILFSTE
jgi:hypothetical protein